MIKKMKMLKPKKERRTMKREVEYTKLSSFLIPSNKGIEIALSYIYGIGRPRAKQIISQLGIDPLLKVERVSEDQKESITGELNKYVLGSDLKSETIKNIHIMKRLGLIKTSKNIHGRALANKRKVLSKT